MQFKKICFVAAAVYSIGGEQTVLAKVANELCKDYDITIYTHEQESNRTEYVGKLDDRIAVQFVNGPRRIFIRRVYNKLYRIYRRYIPMRHISKLHMEMKYPKKQRDFWVEEINREKYDCVITVSGSVPYGKLFAYIKDEISAKVYAWEHSSYEAYFGFKNSYYYHEEYEFRQCWSRLDKIILLTHDMAQKVEENLGVKSYVINNPCSFESEDVSDCSQNNIIAYGRLEFEKGFDDAIEAFALFLEKNKEWKLHIVGGGTLEKHLKEKVAKMQLQDKIIFHGYQKDVKPYLLKSSIYLMTSLWEGYSMTTMEAQEMGVPVVAYAIPALRFLVDDGENGFLVTPGDIDSMSNKIYELSANEELRKKMGAEAKKKSIKFSAKTIGNEWRKIL